MSSLSSQYRGAHVKKFYKYGQGQHRPLQSCDPLPQRQQFLHFYTMKPGQGHKITTKVTPI